MDAFPIRVSHHPSLPLPHHHGRAGMPLSSHLSSLFHTLRLLAETKRHVIYPSTCVHRRQRAKHITKSYAVPKQNRLDDSAQTRQTDRQMSCKAKPSQVHSLYSKVRWNPRLRSVSKAHASRRAGDDDDDDDVSLDGYVCRFTSVNQSVSQCLWLTTVGDPHTDGEPSSALTDGVGGRRTTPLAVRWSSRSRLFYVWLHGCAAVRMGGGEGCGREGGIEGWRRIGRGRSRVCLSAYVG
ncbi:hypothetical protein IWZ03DRAFT_368259, partial [Phyllosticta citriasiana]